MIELLALVTFVLFGVFVIGLVGGMLKLVFWLLFLPLRLIGGLLKLLVGILLLPIFLVLGAVLLLGAGLIAVLGLLVPLLPFLLAGFLIWGLVKLFSRPAAAPSS
jgi:hypothetical protein